MHPASIKVQPVLNGFVVDIGCQQVVFSTIGQLTDTIRRYYESPDKVVKEFLSAPVNKTMGGPVSGSPTTCGTESPVLPYPADVGSMPAPRRG